MADKNVEAIIVAAGKVASDKVKGQAKKADEQKACDNRPSVWTHEHPEKNSGVKMEPCEVLTDNVLDFIDKYVNEAPNSDGKIGFNFPTLPAAIPENIIKTLRGESTIEKVKGAIGCTEIAEMQIDAALGKKKEASVWTHEHPATKTTPTAKPCEPMGTNPAQLSLQP